MKTAMMVVKIKVKGMADLIDMVDMKLVSALFKRRGTGKGKRGKRNGNGIQENEWKSRFASREHGRAAQIIQQSWLRIERSRLKEWDGIGPWGSRSNTGIIIRSGFVESP